jgi:hypothetical protein
MVAPVRERWIETLEFQPKEYAWAKPSWQARKRTAVQLGDDVTIR